MKKNSRFSGIGGRRIFVLLTAALCLVAITSIAVAEDIPVYAIRGDQTLPPSLDPNLIQVCVYRNYSSGTLNTPVANDATQTFTVNAPDAGFVWSITARVAYSLYNTGCMSNPGNSGRVDEVGLRLQDPTTGTWTRLKGTEGGIGEIFDVIFDDNAASSINGTFTPNCSTLSGTYRPIEQFSPFIGLPATGNWTLEVQDGICGGCSTGYGPTLNNWYLDICVGSDIFAPTWPSGVGLLANSPNIGGQVDLTWNAASDYSPPLSYDIYWAAGACPVNFTTPGASTTGTSYSVTGLDRHQRYYFTVRAKDSLNNEDTNTTCRNALPGADMDAIGSFRQSNGQIFWRLDGNFNRTWDQPGGGDTKFTWAAMAGDLPVVGDWNHDGVTDPGVFRVSGTDIFWRLDANGNGTYDQPSGGDVKYTWPWQTGDLPAVGDWDRDGYVDNIGVFRISGTEIFWRLDTNGNGAWDQPSGGDTKFTWPYLPGDLPVVGDFDRDGFTDNIGVYRVSGGQAFFRLDTNGNGTYDQPAGGDVKYTWDWFPGDIPVIGDWDRDGFNDNVGIYRVSNGSGVWRVDANGNGTWDTDAGGDDRYFYGDATDIPVVGGW